MSKDTRKNLEQQVNEVRTVLIRMADLYGVCIEGYNQAMSESLNEVEYLEKYNLIQIHQNKKNKAIAQVCVIFKSTNDFEAKNNGNQFVFATKYYVSLTKNYKMLTAISLN